MTADFLTDTNNGKPFVDEDTVLSYKTSGPIWTAMTKTFGESDKASSIAGRLFKTMNS